MITAGRRRVSGVRGDSFSVNHTIIGGLTSSCGGEDEPDHGLPQILASHIDGSALLLNFWRACFVCHVSSG